MSQDKQAVKDEQKADSRLNKRLKDMPIAIVGMASIFANSRYLNKFWDIISEKIDAITEIPETHWDADAFYDSDKQAADKIYCKRGGFLPEVDFNPMEFGLPPNILELTDTSQLLSLIVAKEVLADANLPQDYDRNKIGITLGVGGGQKINHSLSARLQYPVLKKVFKNSGISDDDSEMLIKKFQDQYIHWEENSFPGSLGNVIAGRIANRFDFGGMNCVVDAACAGSLAAMRMALSELVEGRSEIMITGGVCTDNSPSMYMSFSKTPAFTTNETIQPFDIDSKGMMIGEGIGMVALKRLEDAERDGDRIYSVIKGIGSSSDGKFKSIYAPRPEGQAKALNRAYDDAGFAPHTLGLIEAHGTGTAAGDVAEFNGLCSVFEQGNDTKQHIALGSVKSQIGHTKSTAGTAGLIKAALALHHKVLPATINVSEPNPKLEIENSPFYLNTQTRPWLPKADGTPRRAGISSFGFGGTNFHIVLEEYNIDHDRSHGEKAKYRQREVAQSFLLSAKSKAELITELNQLQQASAQTDFILKDSAAAYPLRELASSHHRLGLVASTTDELSHQLTQAIAQLNKTDDANWQLPNGISYRAAAIIGTDDNAKVAAVFAGQGSQYLNMGLELSCYYPEMRQQFMTADKVFSQHDQTPLSQTVYPIPVFTGAETKAQNANLTNTANAQSAIGAISMGQFELLSAAGFKADMVAGHSFGELSALRAAGVISHDDYYQLTFARGHAMASKAPVKAGEDAADSGAMYAIITKSDADLARLEDTIAQFTGVKVANYNAPTQSVIAGPTLATADAAKALAELGFKAINLPVSGAFHTELVGHAQAPFAKAIDKAKFTKPQCDLYANATGARYEPSAIKIKSAFKKHMLQSVRFTTQLQAMYEDGARVFVEFGPKNILQKLVQATLNDKLNELSVIAINPNPKADSDVQLKQAATQMAVAGIALSNIDPYQADITKPAKKSPMSIALTAANYISPATRKKMADSLSTGQISPKTKIVEVEKVVEKVVEKIVEKVVEVPVVKNDTAKTIVEKTTQAPAQTLSQSPAMSPNLASERPVVSQNKPESNPALPVNADALSHFFAAQQQTAELHQQFLAIPQQYTQTFTQLMVEQTKLAGAGVAIPEALSRSMEQFHQLQAQTLQSHTQFLALQADSNTAASNLLSDQTISAVASVSSQANVQVAMPAPKHSAPQELPPQYTAAPPVVTAPTVVSEPQVPTAVLEPTPVASTPSSAPLSAPSQEPLQVASQQVDVAVSVTPSALNADVVQSTMMNVVSEKTGYPTEMLALEMDMEADLGIDSIKRVEILGTVQDELPNLPELSPEDLSECRTLGEIVSYMNSKLASHLSADVTDAVTASVTATLTQDQVQSTMMSVVSEKTGYPTEMLALEMDMEADLGIDSIKRVEILGTVQDELPNLPELSPEDLSECRTLGEIVNYMNSKLASNLASNPASNLSADVTDAVTASVTATLTQDQVQSTMMSVVSDKTGYPTEMLALEMDMEADLGIDSIKRVEILGTVQDELPNLPELSPEDLSECRTLGEIVNYMNSKLASDLASNPASHLSADVTDAVTASVTATLTQDQVQSTMMSVVSDKTGYPTEMLALEMDMEADLGIDSIKRVEILGTVQDELPNLPELSPEDLSECRTLGEIVSYMNSKLASNLASDLASNPASHLSADVTDAVTASVTATLTQDQVQSTMMSVVSEKTGYPTEMLALEMDMEADLGIDSIKRVEILGTVQDELPTLPDLNPEDLSECRTLGEIVSYMNSKLASDLASNPASDLSADVTDAVTASVTATLTQDQVQSTMMNVVSEKTGYPTEMLALEMDMEADLGIDSIKRVEILGTVQDELPTLPDLNPEDLSECRTLGEIVNYMNSQLATTTAAEAHSSAANQTAAVPATELPPHSEVMLKKLEATNNVEVNSHDQFVARFAKKASIIINDDGHNAGVLAEKLIKQDLNVAVVRLPEGQPQSPLSSDVASFQIPLGCEDEINNVIAQVEQLGSIAGFIHLQPQAQEDESQAINLNEHSFSHVSQAFLWAKLLQPKLAIKQDCRRAFISVSRIDGGFGYLNSQMMQKSELNQAALSGLTKTLSHEWPTVFCRALDIATHVDAPHFAQAIVNELFNTEHLAEVGLSLNDQSELERVTLVSGNAAQTLPASNLTRSDNILVTGGAKGVTFECALALAARTQSHFILAGRSEQLAIPQWAQAKQSHELKAAAIESMMKAGQKPTPKAIEAMIWPVQSSIEIAAALNAFQEVGASAEYISMDVTSTDAITASLKDKPTITGLIHGAGVLADKHIQDKTLDELARVYGTKVKGLQALLAAVNPSELKLLAMFSSAAGFYGNTGQSDYAMSNDILNKAALQFSARNPQAKVMSFNWGPWDGGMVNPALKKMFVERGVYVIPLKAGAQLFATQLLENTGVQLLVGTSMQGDAQVKKTQVKKPNAGEMQVTSRPLSPVQFSRSLNPKALAFIQDHRIGGNAVLPTVCAIQWMREAASEMLGAQVKVLDYKLLKGIIFDSQAVQELTLTLTPIAGCEPQLSALISAQGKPQYKAVLCKCNDEAIATNYNGPALETLPTKVLASKQALYSNGTLFHGPRLQGIESLVHFDDSGLIAKCLLPVVDAADCGPFIASTALGGCQPFAEDLLLQAMLIWARLKYGAGSLPSAIGEFTSHKPMAFGDSGFIELEVIKTSKRSLTANVTLFLKNGELSAQMKAAKVTISKSLNAAFLPAKAPNKSENAS